MVFEGKRRGKETVEGHTNNTQGASTWVGGNLNPFCVLLRRIFQKLVPPAHCSLPFLRMRSSSKYERPIYVTVNLRQRV